MDTQKHVSAARLMLSLAAAAALSGCAVYGPPYAAYDAAPVAAPYYPAYPYYGYGYGYGRPAYVGPPVALNFGYYRHSYRGGGYHAPGWGGGHGWRGAPGGRGPGWGGGRGGFGGHGGGHGGGRGGGHGGGRGHR